MKNFFKTIIALSTFLIFPNYLKADLGLLDSSPSFDSKNGKIRAPTKGSSTIADNHGKEFKFIL